VPGQADAARQAGQSAPSANVPEKMANEKPPSFGPSGSRSPRTATNSTKAEDLTFS
jgi:hypothetical protein